MADTSTDRVSRLRVAKAAKVQTITAQVPSKVSAREFGVIQKSIFDKIKDLTGCGPCLSGGVRVVYEEDFGVIDVALR